MNDMHTNALIHESSPYLLQHAHNPVAWEGWHPEVLEKARKENKLLLISIGYAACHWCHVMEKECFEDPAVAAVMNRHFIPIKVDREERPDIDHIYMDALQLMTGGGGWPLNVAALPDGRPFWGATYVKKDDWIQALKQLAELYEQSPDKVEGYARDLTEGLQAINLIPAREGTELPSLETLNTLVSQWSEYFDTFLGGYKRAPKFMMPGNLNFLLHYAYSRKEEALMHYVDTTLTKMAYGGIYDALGGGFSRYSVDTKWHVPHFEKMLYDNAQLISLYAKAYAVNRNEGYRQVVVESIAFVQEALMAPEHGFYASLDADSLTADGRLEEGAYYVWQETELRSLLGADFPLFKDYYNINSYGHWEGGNYVLIRDATEAAIAVKHHLDLSELQARMQACRELLKKERDRRNPPRLDTKILASWNGLMLQGLVDAARYLERPEYLDLALKNAGFLCTRLLEANGKAYHTYADGKEPISGYLEDYATLIQAFLGLYQQTFDPQWLQRSKTMADYCLEHFTDAQSGMFFFTSKDAPFLVRRTLETSDNVIPASNSIMAKNLFLLSKYFPQSPYGARSRQMLVSMQEQIEKHPQSHANWMDLLLCELQPFYELAITGARALEMAALIRPEYLPRLVLAASTEPAELPLLKDRWVAEKTLLYVCTEGRCQLPVESAKAALEQLKN